MDKQFTQFVYDVQQASKYPDSRIDDNSIVVTIEGRSYLIPRDDLYNYYDSFRHSGYQYKDWVTRTASHVNKLVEQWYKRWHS